MRNHSVFCALLWLLLSAGALAEEGAGKSSEEGPVEVVNAFHAALIDAMKEPGYEQRLAIIGPAVESYFQVETISRISLGRANWRKMDEQARGDFKKQISELITTTYSSRFDNYNGQAFSIQGTEKMKRERMRVKSILTTKSETVTLDYQLQNSDDTWRIYDIVANGVSDLSLKRSNYGALLKSGGLEAVTAEITRNIRDNQLDNQPEPTS